MSIQALCEINELAVLLGLPFQKALSLYQALEAPVKPKKSLYYHQTPAEALEVRVDVVTFPEVTRRHNGTIGQLEVIL